VSSLQTVPRPASGLGPRLKTARPNRPIHLTIIDASELLIVDKIGYLPVIVGGGNLFFQLVNVRYEKVAMILTSNRGFAEWGEVLGDPVVAAARLDGLLHHAIVIQIEGSSYRLRQHADLVPEHIRSNPPVQPSTSATPIKRRVDRRKTEALITQAGDRRLAKWGCAPQSEEIPRPVDIR
jgi:IstB-like ATP binding protein